MAWRFAASSYCKRPSASNLNDIDKFTIACWVYLDTVDSTKKQYLWSHRGASNQISVRKFEGASPVFRFSATVGAVNKTVDSTTVAAINTPYHVVCVWQKAAVMEIWINGVIEASLDVSSFHTVNYDSGDSTTPLHLGAKSDNSDVVLGALEGHMCFVGARLGANAIKSLYESGWPGLAALQPDEFHLFDGSLLSTAPDLSGFQRHVVDLAGTITDAGWIGRWDAEDDTPDLSRKIASMSGGAQPGPWIDWPNHLPHPGTVLVVSGLSPDTPYEFVMNAVGADGQVSADQSVPLVSFANGALIRHTPKKLFIG